MSISGNVELGAFSEQQQSMNISSAIPIRKRRFPIFHPCSPPGEERDSALEVFDSKNKEESNAQDGLTLSSEANNTASLVKSKTSVVDVKQEDNPLKLVDKDILASMSITSLGPLEDLGNTKVILQNEKSYKPEAIPLKKRRFSVFHPCPPPQEENSSALEDLSSKYNDQDGETSSSEANNTASLVDSDVMKKVILQNEKWLEPEVPDCSMIVGGQTDSTSQHQLSSDRMNVELSLGSNNSKQRQNEGVLNKSNKVDSLLSLAFHEEKVVLHDKIQDSAIDSVSNHVSANRSNWDLNTTMDVWEGSTCSDAFAHGIVNIGGHIKSESCHDDKSLLTLDSAARHASTSSSGVDRIELARIDEHTVDSYQNADVSGNVMEQMEIVNEALEDKSFVSDTKSPQNCVGTVCEKEDEDFEDGEVREHVPHLAYIEPIFVGKKNDNVEFVRPDSQNLQLSVSLTGQSISASVFNEKDVVKENLDETHGDLIIDHVSVGYESNENNLQKRHEVSEVVADEQLDKSPRETEVSCYIPTDGSHVIDMEIDVETTAEVVKEICPGEYNLTLSKVEECIHGQDGAGDFNNSSNKSRIINLSSPCVLAAPFKAKSISNRFLTSRSVKERYSEFDGEMQTRGNRNRFFYTGGSNKFLKDQSVRNSRPTFMRGKGRGSGRFGSSCSEWDSNHNFASESSYGQSDYRVMRRKHAPSISDTHFDCNGYSFPRDDNSFGGNKRKIMNNEFPSPRRGSLRRVSFGDRDGPKTRGFQMHNRISRNMSPRRYSDELDNNGIAQENRRRSPVKSQTRSPGPRSPPRRRSPNELRELSQRQSPALYRMGRNRSSDHNTFFHDDMVPRRRGSPSYVACHSNDVDSGMEHIHPRASDSNRKGFYARSNRGADALDSREMDDDNDYLNGSSHSSKYHEVRHDGYIDNRRIFVERRAPRRLFRPNFNCNENFRFHQNDGPKPYRFHPDSETEFVERSNVQEREFESSVEETEFTERSGDQEREFVERCNAEGREFDGRIHQSVAVSRRIRNIGRS